jgi:hypothetical protein
MTYQTTQSGVDHRDDRALKSVDQIAHEQARVARMRYERAQAMAHDPEALDEAQADGALDYSKVFIKVDSRQCDLFRAADLLRLRIMAGRHCEADCIARDMTDALAEEIATLIISGSL